MSGSVLQNALSRTLRMIDHVSPPAVAEAHCDIPCGIYDPHLMQIAALTVVRMNQLIDSLGGDEAKTQANLSRYIHVKEEHAELAKREARIIWGDYFKPEHLEKYKDLHQVAWDIMKVGGKNKQEINAQAAADLLAATQKFAEMFWDSKGVATKRAPSNQAVGGEIVVPA
jgi:nickel superoxide dismutase